MKAQTVRIADVLLFGPLMIWGGWKLRKENPFLGQTLLLAGVGTVFYNGYNFYQVSRGNALPGGYADKAQKTAKDFDPTQLRAGVKVEMEHTGDPEIAKEIAMDHLTEDPQYYVKLKKAGL